MAPSAPRVSSSGRNRPPPLPVRMATRLTSPLSLAARIADSLASPGQSSCFSITQVGEFFRMRRITEGAICTPVETGWSCRHQGTPGPSVSSTIWKYEAIWSSVRSVEGGATITPEAPRSITASVSSFIGAKPADDAPTITGTRPLTRASTCFVKVRASCAVSLVASPMMPRMVRPVTPLSRQKSTMRSVLARSRAPSSVKGVTVMR